MHRRGESESPDSNVVVWENENLLKANTIRLDAEAKPLGKGNPLSSVALEKNPLKCYF